MSHADDDRITNPACHPFGPPTADDQAFGRITSHLLSEQAITMGLWPFVCPYCSEMFQTDRGYFPYCSSLCAVNASEDR